MTAGKLDRRVTIYRLGPVVDDGFSETREWESLGARWCQVIPMSGKEVIEADGKDGQRMTRFLFRWDSVTSGLTELDQLEHDGERYAITGPLIEIERRHWLEVVGVTVGAV